MANGNYVLTSCPVNEVGKWGYSLSIMDNVVAPVLVQASSLAELATYLDAFERSCAETGKPYYVSVYKHSRCKARKISGFDKARDEGGLLAGRFGNCESVTVAA